MKIAELVETRGWKIFIAKLYSLGAAVVLIGALFKIQHWEGGAVMLTIGMTTEAVIFFFSAFEPLHEEVDWTLVYPELAGVSDEEEIQRYHQGRKDIPKQEPPQNEKPREVPQQERPANTGNNGGGGGAGDAALGRFDEMLENSNINQEVLDRLGKGLNNLTETASQLNNLTKASVATDEYVEQVKKTSQTFSQFNENYSEKADELSQAINQLSSSYQQLSESLNGNVDEVSNNNKAYSEKLEQLNKNLSALNAVYELQLQSSNQHMKNNEEVYSGLEEMMKDLKASIEETRQYKQEVNKLSHNLAELNKVYGNMLSSVSVYTN